MRPTEAIVDLGAIARNVERLCDVASPAALCAVTKADGYGHGAVAVSRAALDAGASMVAVALVEEGLELRRNGVRAPILLLSEPRPNEMFEIVGARLTPTVYTPDGIAALVAAVGFEPGDDPLDVHINIDTGMNRVGLRPDDGFRPGDDQHWVIDAVRAIKDKPGIRLAGVWTHFAVADDLGRPETGEQLARFLRVLDTVRELSSDDIIVHACNSAGLLARPEARFDMVRTGIAMYGIAPSAELDGVVELEPALSLVTQLGLIKQVRAGESISYGLRHTFSTDTTVATIPIGYADGLRRDAYARGLEVLVGGKRRPIVGTVTMDQTMIDLGNDTDLRSGEPVVLLGAQGDESITAADNAALLDTIPYEIVCDVGQRIRRRYL
ncbi:MAG: alanine racemase [Actinomycetota bacterium]